MADPWCSNGEVCQRDARVQQEPRPLRLIHAYHRQATTMAPWWVRDDLSDNRQGAQTIAIAV